MDKNSFIATYGQEIKSKIDDIFDLQSKDSINTLVDFSYYFFTKQQFLDNSLEAGTGTGIVITGFGDKEYYPGLISLTIDGKFNENLRYEIDQDVIVTNEIEKSAMVFPFSQTEEVETFFEGVKSKYQEEIEEDMEYILRTIPDKVEDFLLKNQVNYDKDLFREELLKEFEKYVDKLSNYRFYTNAIPKLLMISHLQKEELATFAKTLISLTSFTRKYSFDAETVGGPIDVAVISKFEGFIWIDRKYYFKKKFNPQFKRNYYRK